MPVSASPPTSADGIALTYYGDDFTGSTDVMEALTSAGLPTVLFLDVPTHSQVAAYPDAMAIGVAGVSRTMSPEQMDELLPPLFERIADLGAPLFHYKICSTFDSSPSLGSIGRAAEILRRTYPHHAIPMIVGVPELGRYTAFGTLFATADGMVHRLDRHPTMIDHPRTPMTEADLRRHLGNQTLLPVALVDVRALTGSITEADIAVREATDSGAAIVLLDVLDATSQRTVGRILDRKIRERMAAGAGTVAVIGSSGVEYALRHVWSAPDNPLGAAAVEAAAQTVVIVGSRAPATDAQTRRALEDGFADIPVDPMAVTESADTASAVEEVVERAVEAHATGRHILVRTPPRSGSPPVDGNLLAAALGRITAGIGSRVHLKRLVVAGGDTSGLVARALGIQALRLLRPLAPGAPLCRAASADPRFDGLQVCLKAGQIGEADYFTRIARIGAQPMKD